MSVIYTFKLPMNFLFFMRWRAGERSAESDGVFNSIRDYLGSLSRREMEAAYFSLANPEHGTDRHRLGKMYSDENSAATTLTKILGAVPKFNEWHLWCDIFTDPENETENVKRSEWINL